MKDIVKETLAKEGGAILKKGTSLGSEFTAFAFKGNMIDLAIGVIIGTAFGKVIDSLVKDVLMEFISWLISLTGADPTASFRDKVILGTHIRVGAFFSELVNFLIVAGAVFLFVVKLVGAIQKKTIPPPPPGEPVTKECEYCLSTIPIKAKKCAYCTADLPG